jgi:hypothetical protein
MLYRPGAPRSTATAAGASPDDRELPLPDELSHLSRAGDPVAGAVEVPVPQDHALDPGCGGDGLFDVPDGPQRLARFLARVIHQRIRLALDRAARALVRPMTSIALRDEATDADPTGGRQQMVGCFDTQTVRRREVVVPLLQVPGHRCEGGELVDDDVRLGGSHGDPDALRIERVHHESRGALGLDVGRAGLVAARPEHIVPGVLQQGNKAAAERSSRPRR